MTAYVGGTTAGNIDLADKIGEELPLVILIIVGAQLPAADRSPSGRWSSRRSPRR